MWDAGNLELGNGATSIIFNLYEMQGEREDLFILLYIHLNPADVYVCSYETYKPNSF